MKRKLLAFVFAGSLALSLACGCGGNNSIILPERDNGSSAVKTVSFFGHRTDNKSLTVFEGVLQNFMAENQDINVSYESATETSYFSALEKRFKTDNLDDVFMTDRDSLISFTESDALADLSAHVNTDILSPLALSQSAQRDGKLYAVPTGISTYGLYINYDVLQKYGISVPKNYSEFAAACDFFTGEGITPLIINNYSSLRTLIEAAGLYDVYQTPDIQAELEKINSSPTLLCDGLNKGIDLAYTLFERGWADADQAKSCSHFSGDIQLFYKGENPFMITGSYAAADLRKLLKENGSSLSFGIYPYPVLETGSVLLAQADAMLCVKNGENAEAGKKLVKALTDYNVLAELSSGQGCFTVLKGQTQIHSDPALIPSASYLANGKYVIGSDINLKIPLDKYLTECGNMILNGQTAEAVKSHLYSLLDGSKAGAR